MPMGTIGTARPRWAYQYGQGWRQPQQQTSYGQLQAEQRSRTKERETEIRGLLDKIISQYSPGGAFGQGVESMLSRQKTQAVAGGMQSLVSSGLANTTQAAGLGKKFEEEVGAPTRAKLEDIRYGALAGALGQKASFLQSIQDQIPSPELMAGLYGQATPSSSRTINYYPGFRSL